MNRFDFFKRILINGAASVAAKYSGAIVSKKAAEVNLDSQFHCQFSVLPGSRTGKPFNGGTLEVVCL